MLSMKAILDQLTRHQMVEAFNRWMAENNKDFAADHQRYTDAIHTLRKELGDMVTDEVKAIEQQCASDLLFSGFLGLKANLDHFIDPVARTFLEVDFEVYLREETAHTLPEHVQAQQVRDRFCSCLTPSQQETYEAVISYTSHLETAGPKLAHYYGYMLGNHLLPRVVPGYHADPVLTMRYTGMLGQYFGEFFHNMPC